MVTRNTRQRPIKAVVLRVRAPSAARKAALRMRLETDAIEADGLAFVRPVTRRDCEGAPRPCPWVGCRHHLYLDVKRDGVKLNFPDMQPEDMVESCVLDAAERGGLTDLEVAARLNLVRSRVRQIEKGARAKVGPVLGRHRA
jgi:hypothetical protein